jgi:outer membrane protein assembly factor BamA
MAQVTGDSTGVQPPRLYESRKDPLRYEIGRIELIGNEVFTDDMILSYVSLRPTTSGITEDFVIMYLELAEENGHLGRTYERMLTKTYNELDIDYGFYSESATKKDSSSITTFYKMQGYQESSVDIYFFADTIEEENVLVFDITEGPPYYLDTVVYTNISLLDTLVRKEISKARTLELGNVYNEDDVLEEVLGVKEVLLNNGYYSVYFNVPKVIRDSIDKTDSVIVDMHFGPRVRIGEVTFKHQLNDQTKVSNALVNKLLEFEEGDYYNKRAIDNSEGNLLSLQTFELLNIDTLQVDGYEPLDTVLPFLVYMSYKPQIELGFDAGLVEKVEGYEFVNIRGRANFRDLNIFGGAQTYGANVIGDIRDINRWINSGFSSDFFEWEGQLGFLNYYQPILFKFGQNRVGLNVVGNFSARNAGFGGQSQLEVNTLSGGVKFPIDFADGLWVDNLTLEVYAEKQRPITNTRIEETDNVFINAQYFEQAEEFNSENRFAPTAFVLTTSMFHDTRNDLFDPTSGVQLSSQIDATLPFSLTEYIRAQINATAYLDIGWGSVLAGKLRLGQIFFYGNQNNNYISTARQFFAGGPNSNRGWEPRRLRYQSYSPAEVENELELTPQQFNFLQDFVGNASVIETSLEYRYRFHEIKSLPPSYSDFLKDFGIVVFADVGNSYGWLIDRNINNYSLTIGEIFRNLAISSGLGFRYFTPFGPVRVDLAFPVYGPIETEYQWISEVAPFSQLQFNLGLQHAF